MFSFKDLVPFAEGDTCRLAVRKSLLTIKGTVTVRRLSRHALVLAADIPKQSVIIPASRVLFQYRIDEDAHALSVLARWNGRQMLDEHAYYDAAEDGLSIRVDLLYDVATGERMSYRIMRTPDDELVIDELRGPRLVNGATLRMSPLPVAA